MIEAKEILRLVRYKQLDNNEIRFSDYDIKNALNESLRYIGQSQALQNSDFLLKLQKYNELEINAQIDADNADIENEEDKIPYIDFQLSGIDLPDDYQILAGITRIDNGYSMRPCDAARIPNEYEYKVVGDKIYSGCRAFDMTYKRTLASVDDIEQGQVELPAFCLDLIVKITGLILNQAENDVLLHTVESTARAIIPRRRYNNMQFKMPFMV